MVTFLIVTLCILIEFVFTLIYDLAVLCLVSMQTLLFVFKVAVFRC